MNNQINEPIKTAEISEKKSFLTIIAPIVSAVALIIFIISLQISSINENKNLIKAFNENKELICFSKVVSKSNGYKFDEKRENYVSNGIDIFNINRCGLK